MIQHVRKKDPYVFKINGETYNVLSENLSKDCLHIKFLHLYKLSTRISYVTIYDFHVFSIGILPVLIFIYHKKLLVDGGVYLDYY